MLATAKRRTRKLLAMVLGPLRPLLGARLTRLVTRIVNPREKLYIPASLGVAGFFTALDQRGARHVVLRWFEDLPHVERGHDLDLLVSDEALAPCRALLTTWPLGQKIDLYSETGRDGTGYRPEVLCDVPAFPPDIAARLLGSAQKRPGGWCVPAPEEHFLGLAYHAVYLKGCDAGLPPDDHRPARKGGSHDYADVLTALADGIGRDLRQPVTMQSLDRMLAAEGWRPDAAHLAALARVNPWLSGTC